MQAGNIDYQRTEDIPSVIPIFPLTEALLLPGGRLPLNIFEPRYIAMIDAAIGHDRLIGMIQPALDGSLNESGEPELCSIGTIGRITSFAEAGDGRYLINLSGICRFRIAEEVSVRTPYRQCHVTPLASDLLEGDGTLIDREALLQTFRAYLKANQMDADWESISNTDDITLVNALSMMSPYGAAEKQALLEAVDLRSRAETLIAITEFALARDEGETRLQ